MNELVAVISTGVGAFIATNLDDLVILTLLFSQVDATFRRRHIVCGQYLGFSALVAASLVGFWGGLVIPVQWIGWLGLAPIAIGIQRFFDGDDEAVDSPEPEVQSVAPEVLKGFISPQTFGVAAITFANGSDNIGIYLPLFAKSDLNHLGVIIFSFFVLVGVWCYATHRLTRQPLLAEVLTRYGNTFVPFVLIALGSYLVLDSNVLNFPLLAVIIVGLFLRARITQQTLSPLKSDCADRLPTENELSVHN